MTEGLPIMLGTPSATNTCLRLMLAKAEWYNMVGREVLLIPIQDWAYASTDIDETDDYRKWVLVVEKDGKTWVWDSYTMEG